MDYFLYIIVILWLAEKKIWFQWGVPWMYYIIVYYLSLWKTSGTQIALLLENLIWYATYHYRIPKLNGSPYPAISQERLDASE